MPDAKTAIIQNLVLVDSMDDLKEINEHLKTAWDRVQKEEVKSFTIGQVVEFDSRKGERVRGEVEKINRKTVGVKVTHINGEEKPYGGSYRVPGSMLTVVTTTGGPA